MRKTRPFSGKTIIHEAKSSSLLLCGGAWISFLLIVAALSGCGPRSREGREAKVMISTSGSDTMVNLAQIWAEEYQKVEPGVSIEVGGGGSGVGIRDLVHGVVQVANCSRDMEEAEIEQAKRNTGKTPVEWIVAYDALAIYAHKANPIESILLEDLENIYAEDGRLENWSDLGVDVKPLGIGDSIVRVSRQNSSGTYVYFREKVLNERDFKMGAIDMSGSKDVVALVGKTPGAIGYSGMGYATDGVKFIKIDTGNNEAYEPTIENVVSGKYPLSRSLILYTLGEPAGHVKEYIEWVLSPAGQAIVEAAGYIPAAMVEDAVQ